MNLKCLCAQPGIVLLLITQAGTGSAQGTAVAILTLKEAVEAVSEAAAAIAKLTDSFAHMVSTGVKGYDIAAARVTQNRLRSLSAELSDLLASQHIGVVPVIGNYRACALAKKDHTGGAGEGCDPDAAWREVQTHLQEVLVKVNSILEGVKKERSDFVLETAYLKLMETLESRGVVLQKLIEMPAPKTAEELSLLETLEDKYEILVKNLERATEELNAYIKKASGGH